MTTQFPDRATLFGSNSWDLLGRDRDDESGPDAPVPIDLDEVVNPANFGLRPTAICSACWKGFNYLVRIDEAGLCLESLSLSQEEGTPLARINGIAPGKFTSYDDIQYTRLGLKLPISGILRIGRDIVDDFPRPFHGLPNYLYRHVMDIELDEGNLLAIRNCSARYETFRLENRAKFEESEQRRHDLFR